MLAACSENALFYEATASLKNSTTVELDTTSTQSMAMFSLNWRSFHADTKSYPICDSPLWAILKNRVTDKGLSPWGGGGEGRGLLGLFFIGYMPLSSQNHYPIVIYSVAIL